jgi:hypothetical protein
MPVDGEHLCRLCGNCGYGWAEACPAPVGVPREAPAPAPVTHAPPGEGAPPPAVPLCTLAVSLAATGAGCFLSLRLSSGGTGPRLGLAAVRPARPVR